MVVKFLVSALVALSFVGCSYDEEKKMEEVVSAPPPPPPVVQPIKDGIMNGAAAVQEQVVSTSSTAPTAVCRNGDVERKVMLVYSNDSKLPCEVQYDKVTEEPGNSRTLWSAQSTEGYCEEKMQMFVDKLQGFGFDCNTSN